MSHSVWPHRWPPTRLPRPWDSPGKNTGVLESPNQGVSRTVSPLRLWGSSLPCPHPTSGGSWSSMISIWSIICAKTLFPNKVNSDVLGRYEFGGTLFNPLPCFLFFLCIKSSARQFHVRINCHVGGQMAYATNELIQKFQSLKLEVTTSHNNIQKSRKTLEFYRTWNEEFKPILPRSHGPGDHS